MSIIYQADIQDFSLYPSYLNIIYQADVQVRCTVFNQNTIPDHNLCALLYIGLELDIFSPLIELQQSGNSSLSVVSQEALPTKSVSTTEPVMGSANPTASAHTHEDKNHTSVTSLVEARKQLDRGPASANKTPSPLTISAQDINAGSMDFTEFAATLHMSGESTCSTPLLCKAGKENLAGGVLESGKTTPVGSSTAAPVRVRVSAKKLREIQSPYCSSGGSTAGSITESPLSINASEGGIPRALSPGTSFCFSRLML